MERATSSDGTAIAFEREGAGPVVLLVHGIVSDRRALTGLAARLASSFTVLTLDRRGRGDSGPIGEGGLEAQSDDVAAVIDAVGEPCHVFAHSLGAWAALGAAARGVRLQSLMLYEPPPLTPVLDTLAGHLEVMVQVGDHDAAVTTLLQGLGAHRKLIERLEGLPLWSVMTSLAPTIAPELRLLARAEMDLSKVAAPTLLLRGSKSPSMVREVCDELRATLGAAQLLELDGQDHFAPALAPEAVVAPLLDFVAPR